MGSIYQEFEKRLAEGKDRWADRPREEMLDLFLLALEREEIVAIGYRENAIARRLAAMPIPQDVREILRHALVWAWKDEEMHAIYIRGAILRLGGPFLRMKAYSRQLAGGIGGWASSLLMHARWRKPRETLRIRTGGPLLLGTPMRRPTFEGWVRTISMNAVLQLHNLERPYLEVISQNAMAVQLEKR